MVLTVPEKLEAISIKRVRTGLNRTEVFGSHSPRESFTLRFYGTKHEPSKKDVWYIKTSTHGVLFSIFDQMTTL